MYEIVSKIPKPFLRYCLIFWFLIGIGYQVCLGSLLYQNKVFREIVGLPSITPTPTMQMTRCGGMIYGNLCPPVPPATPVSRNILVNSSLTNPEYNFSNENNSNTIAFYQILLKSNSVHHDFETSYYFSNKTGKLYSMVAFYYLNPSQYKSKRINHLDAMDNIITMNGCGVGRTSKSIIQSLEAGEFAYVEEDIKQVVAYRVYRNMGTQMYWRLKPTQPIRCGTGMKMQNQMWGCYGAPVR